MAIVSSRNTVFVRHLSPQVSERTVRGIFGQCDDIQQVLFRAFPGRATEYYAQIDFKSSKGVVEGHKLSGTPILGVTCQVSVMDPGSKDLLRKVYETGKQGAQPEEIEAPSMAEPQGVQLEYIRRYRELAEAKRLRTVHVSGLELGDTEENLRALCTRFGEIADLRLDEDEQGKRFALVEFMEAAPAFAATSRQGFVVDGKVIVFTESKTLIDTSSYAEKSVHFQSPVFSPELAQASTQAAICVQNHLTPKLVKARLAAAEITKQPVPEEVKAAEAAYRYRSTNEQDEEPVEWAGRSEKDLLRDLAALSRRPPSRERSRRRRRSGSRSRSQRSRRGRRRREGSRAPDGGGRRRRRDAARAAAQEATEVAVDVDDLDLAVVPNTELMVLGESSSYSESASPAAEAQEQQASPAASPPTFGGPGGLLTLDGSAAGTKNIPTEGAKSAEEKLLELGGGSEQQKPAAAPAEEVADGDEPMVDVDEKEQWIAPVDVDEEGSCDEVPDPGEDGEVVPIVGTRARRAQLLGTASPAAVADNGAAAACAGAEEPVPLKDSRATRAADTTAEAAAEAVAEAIAVQLPSGEREEAAVAARLVLPATISVGKLASGLQSSGPQIAKWECNACGEVNKARRERCNNCGAEAPWITVKSPDGEDDEVDELSSASSRAPLSISPARSSSSSVAGSGSGRRRAASRVGSKRSIADIAESPANSIADSSARSVAASGSARSVAESLAQSVADLEDDNGEAAAVVDLAEVERLEQEEIAWEADRRCGEVADARARIFHNA